MTKKVDGIIYIEPEYPAKCELCGKTAELRPYGPGGKRVCFGCGMIDPENTAKMFDRLLDGPSERSN